MDNYLLMGHILKCKIIPKEKVHPELWVGANKKWKAIPRDQIVRKEHNKVSSIKISWQPDSALFVGSRELMKACEELRSV